MSAPRIILASGSAIRATILANAGVDFEAIPAPVDEREIESGLVAEGASPEGVALALAEAKARAVAAANPSAFVIGADQTLDAGGDRWHKPGTRLEARAQLLALSGRSHRLHAAVVGAHGGDGLAQGQQAAGGVQARAARRLGISRSNLNYRIQKLDIQIKDVEYE